MRHRLILLVLTLVTVSALAQHQDTFEVSVGIGTDVIPPASTVFKNHLNLSASLGYSLTEKWA